ncbi:solute carrier family 46 member 2-like [Discoglossus pictus]
MVMVRTWIEPVVAGAQVASSFYDTALLMVVKNYYNQCNTSNSSSSDDELQKSISNFYIYYNMIMGLSPLLSAYMLTKLGDKVHRKITICVPLGGYLISRSFLLFVIIFDWPIQVMFGSALLNGLTGWFSTYWSGVVTWASLGSSETKRSIQLTIIELVYGLAGFFGSLASGHIFTHLNIKNYDGVVLVLFSLACYIFCLLYSAFVLQTPHSEEVYAKETEGEGKFIVNKFHEHIKSEYNEQDIQLNYSCDQGPKADPSDDESTIPASKVFIIIIFSCAVLYSIILYSAEDIIHVFVLKNPLSWGPVEVGYGNAATFVTYITSFLGVYVFSRCMGDLGMIMVGMFSFSSGILIMAFVRWTFLYYIAQAVMMFSLIPTPTIRSMISKRVQGSSYGKVFVVLQMAIDIFSIIGSAGFIKVYQATLDWYSAFCFIFIVLSSIGFIMVVLVRFQPLPKFTDIHFQ